MRKLLPWILYGLMWPLPAVAQLRAGEQPNFELKMISERFGRVADLANHIFQNEDRIRLGVLPGFDGYLYVVGVAPNGNRSLLYPKDSTNNFLAGRGYTMVPEPGWFGFTFENLTEQLEVYLSRSQIPVYENARRSGALSPGPSLARPVTGVQSLDNSQTSGSFRGVTPDSIIVSAQVSAQLFPQDGVIGTTLLVPHAQAPH